MVEPAGLLLRVTRYGAWYSRFDLNLEPSLGERVQFNYRGILWEGTIVQRFRNELTWTVHVLPGNGLRTQIPERLWRAKRLENVLAELAKFAGEKISSQSDHRTYTFMNLAIPAGTITQALGQLSLSWHCTPNGDIVIGDVWPEQPKGHVPRFVRLGIRPSGGVFLDVGDAFLFPTPDTGLYSVSYLEDPPKMSVIGREDSNDQQ